MEHNLWRTRCFDPAIRLRVGLDVLQLYQLSTIIEYVLMHVSKEFILFLGYACHAVQNFDVVV